MRGLSIVSGLAITSILGLATMSLLSVNLGLSKARVHGSQLSALRSRSLAHRSNRSPDWLKFKNPGRSAGRPASLAHRWQNTEASLATAVDFSSSARNGLWQSVVGLRNVIMEAGMTDQYHLINWNNLPDSSKITMVRDRIDQLTTQLHQLIMQVRQLTGQVQQLASGFATMQAGLNEMQARLDDLAPVRSSGGGGITE
jgi:hypothetical protein